VKKIVAKAPIVQRDVPSRTDVSKMAIFFFTALPTCIFIKKMIPYYEYFVNKKGRSFALLP
jgi:hypothetical protein